MGEMAEGGFRGGLRKEGSKLPFELVGEVTGSSAVAKASDIEGGTAARHLEKKMDWWCGSGSMGEKRMVMRRGWRWASWESAQSREADQSFSATLQQLTEAAARRVHLVRPKGVSV